MFLNVDMYFQAAAYLALCLQFSTPCLKIDSSLNLSRACKGTKCTEACEGRSNTWLRAPSLAW